MPTFIVEVREVHTQAVRVEAEDKKDAIERVRNGEGQYLDGTLEYAHTLSSDSWTVSPADPQHG